MNKRMFIFPEDRKEYEREMEIENERWDLMKLFDKALAKGIKPSKDNMITIVDPDGIHEIEFRAIRRGEPHKVVMYDKKNYIEHHYQVVNQQRHGLYFMKKEGKIVKMGTYKHNKLFGKLQEWDEESESYKTTEYYD